MTVGFGSVGGDRAAVGRRHHLARRAVAGVFAGLIALAISPAAVSASEPRAQPAASLASSSQLCVGPSGTFVPCGRPGQAPVAPGGIPTTVPAASQRGRSRPALGTRSRHAGTRTSFALHTHPATSDGGLGVAGGIALATLVVDLAALLVLAGRRLPARQGPHRRQPSSPQTQPQT